MTRFQKFCFAVGFTTGLAAGAIAALADSRVIVWDKTDSLPVEGASVISSGGIILGTTDTQGAIKAEKHDFPLSIRCMGYEPATASTPADSIFLSQAAYPLAEIVITPGDRPIAHLTAYAREYSTGTFAPDTMQLFNEYMFDCFLTKDEDKVKGYKKGDADLHTLNVRRFGRIVNGEQRDSVMRPEPYDEVTGLSFISSLASIPSETKQETEAMLSGALCDTISGKFYPKYFYRKSKNIFTIDGDVLADKKDHTWSPWVFKMFGMTMDFESAKWQWAYRPNDTGKYNFSDLISATYNIHVLARGKLFKWFLGVKHPVGIDCFVELYPVDIEWLTVEEYKELKKDKKRTSEFIIPESVPPLPAPFRRLVDRINAELPLHD